MNVKRATIALIALLALTGCAEVGSFAEKAQIDLALNNLTTELDALAGITTEYTAELQADFTYIVSVHATGPQLDTEQLVAAALLAREEFDAGVFERATVWFDLAGPEGIVLYGVEADADELRSGIELAAAVGEAYGSTASVGFGEGVQIGMATVSSSPDWNAIRALVDGNPTASWGFPGLSFVGDMPSAEVTDLVDSIGEVMAPGNSDELYFSLDWYGESATVTVAAIGVDVTAPMESDVWPKAVQVAQLIGASQLPARSFMFYGLDNQGAATVHFGECADSVVLSDADTVLAEALALNGVHPGQCLRA